MDNLLRTCPPIKHFCSGIQKTKYCKTLCVTCSTKKSAINKSDRLPIKKWNMRRRPSHGMWANSCTHCFFWSIHFTTNITMLSSKNHYCCYEFLETQCIEQTMILTSPNMNTDVTLRSSRVPFNRHANCTFWWECKAISLLRDFLFSVVCLKNEEH